MWPLLYSTDCTRLNRTLFHIPRSQSIEQQYRFQMATHFNVSVIRRHEHQLIGYSIRPLIFRRKKFGHSFLRLTLSLRFGRVSFAPAEIPRFTLRDSENIWRIRFFCIFFRHVDDWGWLMGGALFFIKKKKIPEWSNFTKKKLFTYMWLGKLGIVDFDFSLDLWRFMFNRVGDVFCFPKIIFSGNSRKNEVVELDFRESVADKYEGETSTRIMKKHYPIPC